MKKNTLLKNAIYKFILNILKILIPIITFPYIYRIFNPEIMGKVEFSQSLSSYFVTFAGFGVYNYGLREVSRIRNNETEKNKIFTELLIISVVSTILTLFIYFIYIHFKFSKDILLKNMLLINSINIFSYIIYIEWINEAFENYKFISLKTITVRLLNLICIFLFIKKENDYYKYLLFLNGFIFINNFISFFYIKRYVKLNFKELKLRKYFLPLIVIFFITNINNLYTGLDKILLGFYAENIKEVAYYGIAQRVMSLLVVVVMSVISVTMPRLSHYLGENKKIEYEKMLNEISSFMYLLLFPISIGIIILSEEIALFFGGESYLAAKAVLMISGIRIIFLTISGLLSNNVIFLQKKEKVMLSILVTGLIINSFMKLILIKVDYFNASSVALTTMLVELILIILEYFYIKEYLDINLNIFKIESLKYLLFSSSFFVIKYFFKGLQVNHIVYSILIFICCFFIYTILLLISKDKCLFKLLNKFSII